jgi:hypothetical protein
MPSPTSTEVVQNDASYLPAFSNAGTIADEETSSCSIGQDQLVSLTLKMKAIQFHRWAQHPSKNA